MTNARPENYWIAPDALYITLNAMGQPDYLQGNVSSGAVIMCYMCGIDGLSFDAGHNYRRWPLAVSPTYFNTSTPKYVYAAIPKSETVNAYAQIVYPSEKIDLYGKNAKGEQIGVEGYYFVSLQGIISASVATDGTTQMRSWTQRVDCGSLASDEAIAAGGTDAWWKYSSVDDTVTFLKTIAKAVFDNITAKIATIAKLILNGHEINGVATKDTPATSDDTLVTPKYIKDVGDSKYLRKDQDDETKHKLTMGEAEVTGDASVGGNLKVHGKASLDSDAEIKGNASVGGDLSVTGKATTKDLLVTGTAHFFQLEIDSVKSSSGGRITSSADGFRVADVEQMGGNRIRVYWLAQDADGRAVMNMWKTGDQALSMSFNLGQIGADGKGQAVSNHYYWCLVTAVSPAATPVDRTVGGVTKKYNWIELSTETKAKNCTVNPAIGDDVVQLGHRGSDDPARQNAIYESSYVSLDPGLTPPLRANYRGISDFDLASHRSSYQDANTEVIDGSLKVLNEARDVITVKQRRNGLVTQSEPDVLDIVITSAYGTDVTRTYTLNVERDSGDTAADAQWNLSHKNIKSSLTITPSDLTNMGLAQGIFFTIKAVPANSKKTTLTASVCEKLDTTRKFNIKFSSNRRVVYDDDVDMAITAHIMYGDDDYTDHFLADSRTTWTWTRDSGVEAEDNAWKPTIGASGNILLVEHHFNSNTSRMDCGSKWAERLHVLFHLEAKICLDSMPSGTSVAVTGTTGIGSNV